MGFSFSRSFFVLPESSVVRRSASFVLFFTPEKAAVQSLSSRRMPSQLSLKYRFDPHPVPL